MSKISIRFYNDREVRAVWDEVNSKWWFSVLDIVGVLNDQDDYQKNRNYWKYLKTKLRKEQSQLVSATNHFPILAFELCFEIFPVVSVFLVVVLVVQHPDDIKHRKPPLGILLIPNSSHLTVIIKSNGYFGHKQYLYLLILLSKLTHNLGYYGNLHINCYSKPF